MKNLFRKLRQRNQGDNQRGATLNTKNKTSEDRNLSTGREVISNAATTPQHDSSTLLTPEGGLPTTEAPQPIVSPDFPALVESEAHRKNASDFEDTIQVHIKPHCSTCCSLDARRTPPHTEDDWAKREYNVAAVVLSRKLSIKRAQLLSSSASGCIYCIMVSKALSTIRPGWETEDSFIEIFLAPNLPVVVRWINGSTSTTKPFWEEAFGVYVQHHIEWRSAKTPGIIEPDTEFEIYRPDLPLEKGINNSTLSPLVNHIGVARELAPHAGELECFKFISDQATTCLQQHNCGSRMPPLPDRIIWVKPDNSGEIRLVEPKNVYAQYVALSYCWGPVQPGTFLTDAATLADRKAGINVEDLPPLFLGIINCARMLRIEYIWIDRLCIIQGDDEDFRRQAPKMSQYYGNATIAFATASANSEMDDILVERDTKWKSTTLKMESNQLGSLVLRFRQRLYPLGTESRGGDYGKISTRAWTWQERLLAARTIFFTPTALKFECHQYSVWESFGPSVTSPSWSARLEKMTHLSWLTLVEEFTKREITRSSDRLPAINAVMQRVAKARGWVPIWGMWSEFLEKSLAWGVTASGEWAFQHRCVVHPKYYAPSWSWASVEGPVYFGHCRSLENLETEHYKSSLKVLNVDLDEGVLTVFAHWSFASIRCRVEHPYTTPATEYHYECTTVRQVFDNESRDWPSETPVLADVVLQPVKRKLSLLEDGTITRVPHGQNPPPETWTSKCLCIMLGSRPTRATVLLLGESQRIPGAYERIGLAAAWPPEMFTANGQLSFKIA